MFSESSPVTLSSAENNKHSVKMQNVQIKNSTESALLIANQNRIILDQVEIENIGCDVKEYDEIEIDDFETLKYLGIGAQIQDCQNIQINGLQVCRRLGGCVFARCEGIIQKSIFSSCICGVVLLQDTNLKYSYLQFDDVVREVMMDIQSISSMWIAQE
eukprot:TRINITY_DN1162_c0_g1_i8.p6 TRINITY_DN1162_c0_g1~~TRINITY_DN1162_c0_g1_i8.p6  ORF type:complete len:159 (+),score=16.30 TRINITY_DN1162_c0_g1_i8:703-1179(+)